MAITDLIRASDVARFWSKIERQGSDDCWLWIGHTSIKGYGIFHIRRKTVRAHRLSWILSHGEIPSGKHILHSCETRYAFGELTNRRCCNPSHLRAGTNPENVSDMISKKRHVFPVGEQAPAAKLSAEDVLEIRNSSETQRALAAKHGVSKALIYAIRKRLSWRHVS